VERRYFSRDGIGVCQCARRAIIEAAMAAQKFMLTEFPWNDRYRVAEADDVITPALIVYPEIIASNIDSTLRLLNGNADRWRAHIKTAKLNFTLRMLIDRGVRNFKCATTLELLEACRTGAKDVLVAYPHMGANARRIREIAEEFPRVTISVLAENEDQVGQWRGSSVGIFLDINPGMNRTGIEQSRSDQVAAMAKSIDKAGLEFRGLHYYDGQYGSVDDAERTTATHKGYDRLLQLADELKNSGISVREVVTAGTPTFPCSLSFAGLRDKEFIHRVSPGTVVYCDATCLAQLPAAYGYAPAVLVMSRVVSHPHENTFTCDAGHKAVSADAGVPTCVVVGHADLTPLSPSEEHLPIKAKSESALRVGDLVYLLPRHICPTVNNFDSALLVRNGRIQSTEKVSARGHEDPLPRNTAAANSDIHSAVV
jgi:D-serine deaminase-like pyridoxal phosphate-dependent protein